MQLAERILRELTTAPLLTRQLAAKLDARTPGVMVACRCLRHKGLIHTENGLHALTRAGKNLLADGGFIPCQRKGRNATSAGRTLRQRAWSVMRSRITRSIRENPIRNWFCLLDRWKIGQTREQYCRAQEEQRRRRYGDGGCRERPCHRGSERSLRGPEKSRCKEQSATGGWLFFF